MRHYLQYPAAIALWATLFAFRAYAELRVSYEDHEVVRRAEMVIVGGIVENSIRYVRHQAESGRGASWEHVATLKVAEVLRGEKTPKEIPILIHYGLDPVVDGYMRQEAIMINLRGSRKEYPKGIIEIVDTGNSGQGGRPLVKDARENNIWFLRKRSTIWSAANRPADHPARLGPDHYGIIDPEDLQPLALKAYFGAYLSKNPEQAVRMEMGKNAAVAARALNYLHHCEVQRIISLTDAPTQVEKLLPYYLGDVRRQEARRAIVKTGEIGGRYLISYFDDLRYRSLRLDIISAWGEMRCESAVDVLTKLLQDHDRFWAAQKIGKLPTPLDREQKYTEICYALYNLGRIGDPRAREAIELTKRRWQTIDAHALGIDRPRVVENCEMALRVLLKN